jgi:serine/threonine-protein kinase
MQNSWDFHDGEEIAPGRFAVKRLGGGNRYEAYLGWDEHLLAPVVLKVIRPDQVADRAALRALQSEAATARRLNHPVILRVFDVMTDGPRPHIVLESLDGPRLSTLVRKYGPLSIEQLLPLGLEIASGLHYMAAESTVHLDVKPTNIIMGAPPRLIDLSIARSLDRASQLDHPVGTDAYMAPEQCDPPRSGTPGSPADVWGLGATLFEACTGYRPFPRGVDDPQAPVEEQWPQLVRSPLPFPKRVPDAVAKPILSCLHKQPTDRPTAAELAQLLEPLVDLLPRPVLGGFKPKRRH